MMPNALSDKEFGLLQKAVENVDSAYTSEVTGLAAITNTHELTRQKIAVALKQLEQIVKK